MLLLWNEMTLYHSILTTVILLRFTFLQRMHCCFRRDPTSQDRLLFDNSCCDFSTYCWFYMVHNSWRWKKICYIYSEQNLFRYHGGGGCIIQIYLNTLQWLMVINRGKMILDEVLPCNILMGVHARSLYSYADGFYLFRVWLFLSCHLMI